MPAYFDKGVFTASTWHGMEEISEMTTAAELIEHGERVGAYPIEITTEPVFAHLDEALVASADGVDEVQIAAERYRAIVGHYHSTPAQRAQDRIANRAERRAFCKVLGINGGRYRATLPEEWRELILAAGKAGAKPTGCFSLHGGSRVVATFKVSDKNGIVTHLVIADSFDGTSKLMVGFTSVRTVCANTLDVAFRKDGKAWANIRHTSSLEEKISKLAEAIAEAVEHGHSVAKAFADASNVQLQRDKAIAAFDALFPKAADDASQRAKTRAENLRTEARLAAALPVNRVGDKPGNVGTLWNAATYLVDRRADGKRRETRGGSENMVSSMLFGSRAKRLEEISSVIAVVMTDGTVENMTVTEAKAHGIDDKSIGGALVESMLDDN